MSVPMVGPLGCIQGKRRATKESGIDAFAHRRTYRDLHSFTYTHLLQKQNMCTWLGEGSGEGSENIRLRSTS